MIEVYAAGPQALERRAAAAAALGRRCWTAPSGAGPPADRFANEALVAATSSMVTARLAAGDIEGHPRPAPAAGRSSRARRTATIASKRYVRHGRRAPDRSGHDGVTSAASTRLIARAIGLATRSGPPNVFTTLARHRRLFRRWLRFAGALMPGGRLPRADTELVILRVAHNCGCEYEWGHHERLGRRAGLSAGEIAARARGRRRRRLDAAPGAAAARRRRAARRRARSPTSSGTRCARC